MRNERYVDVASQQSAVDKSSAVGKLSWSQRRRRSIRLRSEHEERICFHRIVWTVRFLQLRLQHLDRPFQRTGHKEPNDRGSRPETEAVSALRRRTGLQNRHLR